MTKPIKYLCFLLWLFPTFSWAQVLIEAQQLADSTDFLIYEDMDLDLAQQLNQQAISIFQQFNHTEGLLQCQINQAALYAQKDSFQQALRLLSFLEQQHILPTDSRLYGLFLTSKAWALWGLTQYEQAYTVALKARPILRHYKDWDRFSSASLLATYSIYYNNESDFSLIDQHMDSTYINACKYLSPSRRIFKYIYQLYGAILYQQGRIDQAIQITKQGLYHEQQFLAQKHLKKDSSIIAKYYSNLGRMYAENNDIEQAINYYTNAFLYYQQLKKYPELIKLCTRIGNLYKRKNKRLEADDYFGKIPYYIALLDSNPFIQKRENSFEHLAMAYYYEHFQQHDSILAYYQANMAYIEQYQLATDKAYLNMGMALEALGDYKQAKDYYLRALQLVQQKYGHQGTKTASIYFNLGHLAAEQQLYSQAITYMDTVIFLLDQSPRSNQDKLQLLEYLLDKSIAIEAYHKRGEVYAQKGNYHKAHADFNSIIILSNYLRDHYTNSESKLLSNTRLRPIYEKAASAAWQLFANTQDSSYQRSIFKYAEQSKATLLNENMLKFRNQYTQGGLGIPKHLLQEEEKYIAQIDHCKEHIQEAKRVENKAQQKYYLHKMLALEQQLDSLETFLQKEYTHYRSWDHGRDSILSPTEVQQYLSKDELFIEYFISPQHCFIIYISKEAIKIKELPHFDLVAFKSSIRDLRQALSDPKFILQEPNKAYQTFCKEAYSLYKTFLEDACLDGKKHLIIVPDRHLHYIPFEALLTSLPSQKKSLDYSNLAYLLREYSIHYEYSAAIMIQAQQQQNTSNGQILGFAPTYGQTIDYQALSKAVQKERTEEEIALHNSVSSIPGTVEEIHLLQKHFYGDFFIGEAANEHHFKQQLHQKDYSIIHLAMHGMVNYNHPAYSSLMFTETLDSLEDNLLYTYEAQHLDGTRTNLVVLSACKTGYGKYIQGEGIISLGRSFMYAGIPSIVMSLWELNDNTSVQVMQSFYQNLAIGKSKDKALQEAKLAYLSSNKKLMAHPFFWAGVVGIGNPQAIPLQSRQNNYLWYLLAIIVFIAGSYWFYKRK